MIIRKELTLVYTFLLSGFVASLTAQDGLSISGFVDGSMAVPVASGSQLAFSFDGVETDLEKTFAQGVTLRADIDFFEGAADITVPLTDSTSVDVQSTLHTEVEQAYMTFKLFNVRGVATPAFTFGKFNAPIGFELLDAPDMYQFSHSLVFDNALPTNLTGMAISQTLAGGFDLVTYLANGWDTNANDDGKMIFGGRLGWAGIEGLALGASGITHDETDALVIDLDGTVTSIPNLTLGFEYNQWLGQTFEDSTTSKLGWLVMLNYALDDFGITLRQDAWGKSSSTTVSPSWAIADGAGMLFEFRMDKAYDYVTGATGSFNTAAMEFTFSF